MAHNHFITVGSVTNVTTLAIGTPPQELTFFLNIGNLLFSPILNQFFMHRVGIKI